MNAADQRALRSILETTAHGLQKAANQRIADGPDQESSEHNLDRLEHAAKQGAHAIRAAIRAYLGVEA